MHKYQGQHLPRRHAGGTTSASATGNITSYGATGAVTSYENLTLTLGGVGTAAETLSVEIATAANATSKAVSDVGMSCTMSASLACGIGALNHDAAADDDLGATMLLTISAAAATGGLTNVTLNGSVGGYTGSLNSTILSQGVFPAWNISGGTVSDTATISGTVSMTSAGAATSGTVSVTDSADHGSAAFTASISGGTGVITDTATPTTVATFTVDASGNGTIQFSDGTTGKISNWQVAG